MNFHQSILELELLNIDDYTIHRTQGFVNTLNRVLLYI